MYQVQSGLIRHTVLKFFCPNRFLPPAGPAESKSLAVDVTAAGAVLIEAPVLGSQPEAEQGTLLVMVRGQSR